MLLVTYDVERPPGGTDFAPHAIGHQAGAQASPVAPSTGRGDRSDEPRTHAVGLGNLLWGPLTGPNDVPDEPHAAWSQG